MITDWLWIDPASIDQHNTTDRNEQVNFMHPIDRNARHVII
jgi:Heterokaryon incompatibility protein (HET)